MPSDAAEAAARRACCGLPSQPADHLDTSSSIIRIRQSVPSQEAPYMRDVVAGRPDSAQNENNQVIRAWRSDRAQRLGFEGAPNRGLKAHVIRPDQL